MLPRLARVDPVSVDTEADSLHAYPEKLCLVQVSVPGLDVLVDPLANMDLRPLFAILRDRTLILHAADYDMRLMHRTFRFRPSRVFDTMLAARLLGEDAFGLHHLVKKFLGIEMHKGSQKANWARRPLTERMADYARNDTRHLQALADVLAHLLKAKGRLEWHQEWCDRLIGECCVDLTKDQEMMWRIKGSSRLNRRGLATLRELWHWRERQAVRFDRPPYFVVGHEILVGLADAVGHGANDHSLPFPDHISSARRAGMFRAIARARELPDGSLPDPHRVRGRRPDAAERRRMDRIRSARDREAERLNLDPTLIASRSAIAALARDWAQHAETMMKWQIALLESWDAPPS